MNILTNLGVIGGADGPTVLFVSTTPDAIVWLSVILVAVSFGIIAWGRKHRK